MRAAHRAARLLVVIGALHGASASAQEQPWNPYGLEVYREGPGVKVGNTGIVFHPGVTVEAGYDSNVFFVPTNEVGSALLRLRLHLDLAPGPRDDVTPTAYPQIDFRLSGQVEYRQFLSSNADVRAQSSVNAIFSGFLTLFPHGHATLRLDEDLIRSQDPRNGESQTNFARVYNRAGITGALRPGQGRLEVGVGDFFVVQHFDAADEDFGNSIQNDAKLFARFRLFPRTVLMAQVRVGFIRYQTNLQLETVPLRATVEVVSSLTHWLEGTLMLGYGNSLALHGTRFSSAISREELRFLLPLGINITLGHYRDFYDSLFATDYVDDTIYVGYQQPFLHRFRAYLEGAVRFRHYDDLVAPSSLTYLGYSSTKRSDIVYDGHAGVTAQARRWLAVSVTYNLLADHTGFAFVRTDGTSVSARYIKHTALAQLDFAY